MAQALAVAKGQGEIGLFDGHGGLGIIYDSRGEGCVGGYGGEEVKPHLKKLMSSEIQEWGTPLWFFNRLDNIFNFDLDPCCLKKTAKCKNYYTPVENGLLQDWTKYDAAFVNPPFGREITKWIKKGYESSKEMKNVCFLIPARPDTRYWHNYCFSASAILFIKGRLKFENPYSSVPKELWTSAPFPSALVVFGNISNEQMKGLSDLGVWMNKIYQGQWRSSGEK